MLRGDKARNLRYKKPISKFLNFDQIRSTMWDIQEACEEVRWYTDSEDGEDSLINALDGNDDEAYEFRMAFADLCAECDQMLEDLEQEWVPDCFDRFFVIASSDDVLGWDSYEGDYYRLASYESKIAREESKKYLKRMTKDELIDATQQCLGIYQAYIGLINRYDNLKAAIDILRDSNTGYLQVVKNIEELYEKVSDPNMYGWEKECRIFDQYINALPQEAWVS